MTNTREEKVGLDDWRMMPRRWPASERQTIVEQDEGSMAVEREEVIQIVEN